MGLMQRVGRFFSEVRRRKVFRAASIYVVAIWTLSMGAAELFPAFGVPDWGLRLFVIAAVLGFPLVVIGAWALEITSEGVVLDRVAKVLRENPDRTRIGASSSTTTWAQTQHIVATWQDESGEHAKEFSTGFIMGRDTVAELRIDNPRISRLHARVSYERGRWWIEDLSSRNGTNVNGHLILEKTPLEESADVYLYEGGLPLTLQVRRNNTGAPGPPAAGSDDAAESGGAAQDTGNDTDPDPGTGPAASTGG
jgi:hypothetical protein